MSFKHNQSHVGSLSLSQLCQPWPSRSWQSLRYSLELPCNTMPVLWHWPALWRVSASQVLSTQPNEVVLIYKQTKKIVVPNLFYSNCRWPKESIGPFPHAVTFTVCCGHKMQMLHLCLSWGFKSFKIFSGLHSTQSWGKELNPEQQRITRLIQNLQPKEYFSILYPT